MVLLIGSVGTIVKAGQAVKAITQIGAEVLESVGGQYVESGSISAGQTILDVTIGTIAKGASEVSGSIKQNLSKSNIYKSAESALKKSEKQMNRMEHVGGNRYAESIKKYEQNQSKVQMLENCAENLDETATKAIYNISRDVTLDK